MANFLTGLLDAYKSEGKRPMRSEARPAPIVGRQIPVDPSAPNPNEVLEPEDLMPAVEDEPMVGRNVAQSYMGASPLMNQALMSKYMNIAGAGKTSSRRRGFDDSDSGAPSQRENASSVIDYVKTLPEYSDYQNQTKMVEDQLSSLKQQEMPRAKSEVGPLLALIDSLTGSNLMAGYNKESPTKAYTDKMKSLTDLVSSRKQNMFNTLLGAPKDLLLDTDVVRTDDRTTNVNQNTQDNKIKESAADKGIDKEFAEQFNKYTSGGGAQAFNNYAATAGDMANALESLEKATVNSDGSLGGDIKQAISNRFAGYADILNPSRSSAAISRLVKESSLSGLREMFGAQFTAKENEDWQKMQGDANLSPRDRLLILRDQMSKARAKYQDFIRKNEFANAKMATSGKRSLVGYEAELPGEGFSKFNSGTATSKTILTSPKKKSKLDQLFGE